MFNHERVMVNDFQRTLIKCFNTQYAFSKVILGLSLVSLFVYICNHQLTNNLNSDFKLKLIGHFFGNLHTIFRHFSLNKRVSDVISVLITVFKSNREMAAFELLKQLRLLQIRERQLQLF